jgi:hypothetical protein
LNDFRVIESSISSNDQGGTFNSFGDGEEDACDERFAVMGLLEDGDLFTKT